MNWSIGKDGQHAKTANRNTTVWQNVLFLNNISNIMQICHISKKQNNPVTSQYSLNYNINKEWWKNPANNENKNIFINNNSQKKTVCVYQCVSCLPSSQIGSHASFRVVSESATGQHQGIKQVLATTIDWQLFLKYLNQNSQKTKLNK